MVRVNSNKTVLGLLAILVAASCLAVPGEAADRKSSSGSSSKGLAQINPESVSAISKIDPDTLSVLSKFDPETLKTITELSRSGALQVLAKNPETIQALSGGTLTGGAAARGSAASSKPGTTKEEKKTSRWSYGLY